MTKMYLRNERWVIINELIWLKYAILWKLYADSYLISKCLYFSFYILQEVTGSDIEEACSTNFIVDEDSEDNKDVNTEGLWTI